MKNLLTESLAVHAGRDDFHDLGVHAPPLDLSSTYPLGDLEGAGQQLQELAEGGRGGTNPVYSRLANPTVSRFENGLASLEAADEAVGFASGMAAITACLMAARTRGRHVVAIRPLYGGTDHLLTSGLLDLDVTWARADEVRAALRPETSLVLLETPANPTLVLADIEAIVDQAGAVPVLVDSTFATPVLQRPLDHGAAYSLHSATKFLGGHGDVLAGIVATDAARAAELRRIRLATGAVLHPLAAWLLHRGLPTLPVRVRRAQDTAGELARRLVSHPAVGRVHYPGLPGGDPQHLLGRQMRGPGAILAFEVRGGEAAAARAMARVRLATAAVSLGSVDTLIQHPAALTHRVMAPEDRDAAGIGPGLLRVSVGLEHVDDLWDDLAGALVDASSRFVTERMAGDAGTSDR